MNEAGEYDRLINEFNTGEFLKSETLIKEHLVALVHCTHSSFLSTYDTAAHRIDDTDINSLLKTFQFQVHSVEVNKC